MKLTSLLPAALLLTAFASYAQQKLNPVIKSTGAIFDVPYAVEKPDPNQEYKIVSSIGSEIEQAAEVHTSLMHFARMYNLHIYGGISQQKLKVVLVIYQRATPIVLNNEAYKARYKVDNPNLPVIEELRKAGVQVMVCSQSIEVLALDHTQIAPAVIPATSRFTVLTTYEGKGYVPVIF